MSEAQDDATTAAVTATTPPVGVSTRQIFTIALIVLGFYGVQGTFVELWGTAGDKSAFHQSTINLALLAAGYYLGSSASSRNKDHA